METALHTYTTAVSIGRPILHQPVGLPLFTNGPDNAKENANDNNRRRGRCWGQVPG